MANLLTNKLGPLPTWGWLGIATAGIGGYYLYEKSKGNAPAATSGQGQTPEYVFQNYNELPPETPAPTGPPVPTEPPPTGTPEGKRHRLTKAQETLLRRAGEGREIRNGSVSEADWDKAFKDSGTPRSWVIKQSEHPANHRTKHRRRKPAR